MKKSTRLPAYPLVTHDPFFSLWSCTDLPTVDDTRHWTGQEKFLRSSLTIDGLPYRCLGRGGRGSMKCLDIRVTPLSTEYLMEAAGVRLTLRFTSPLLPDDFDILSTPITYIDYDITSADGKEHDVTVHFSVFENMVYAGGNAPRMRTDFFTDDGLRVGYLGQMRQTPLGGSGDHLTIDWGYVFLAAEEGEVYDAQMSSRTINWKRKGTTPFKATLMTAYDDVASINYFGRLLPAYYARNGKTILQALQEFRARHDEIISRCEAFDAQLLRKAEKLGGKDLALIVTAAYRQSVAAHKLVADVNGDLLFISKEDDSNGCAATVDVSYPSVPLYLLYAPELVRAMCRPVFKFARMPIWHYDFAPHDVGRYPVLNGQIYAAYLRPGNHSEGNTIAPYYLYPASVDAYMHEKQMPVEESANMILMLAAAGKADGDYSLAMENMDLLEQWCRYLLEFGEDPGEQLCTDDFAGHLARNVNLSAKAFMGVAAFAGLLRKAGRDKDAAKYESEARRMADSWLKRADAGDYTYLTFDKTGWSQKYNLVWDKLFGMDLLPASFYEKELKSYLPRQNRYGLPLDSRADYTKSDWVLWTASMAEDKKVFRALIAPVADYLRESGSRVPFSDFYNTVTGYYETFIGRSVQGGCFMPLLMEEWKKRK